MQEAKKLNGQRDIEDTGLDRNCLITKISLDIFSYEGEGSLQFSDSFFLNILECYLFTCQTWEKS